VATSKKSIAALEKALSAPDVVEALANCRDLIPDEGEGPQQVVVHAFACIFGHCKRHVDELAAGGLDL